MRELPTDEEMARMDHMGLLMLRRAFTRPEDQARIAPFEHRAFAREQVKENPIRALGLLGLIPGYQAAKTVGLMGARTKPSLEQMKGGLLGVYEGLR